MILAAHQAYLMENSESRLRRVLLFALKQNEWTLYSWRRRFADLLRHRKSSMAPCEPSMEDCDKCSYGSNCVFMVFHEMLKVCSYAYEKWLTSFGCTTLPQWWLESQLTIMVQGCLSIMPNRVEQKPVGLSQLSGQGFFIRVWHSTTQQKMCTWNNYYNKAPSNDSYMKNVSYPWVMSAVRLGVNTIWTLLWASRATKLTITFSDK